ncbi:hypothetical protein M885DRAFT_509548 [Pelagophyceae sp. CCMP2097]|nr:hypothetical protein M885DRAFT_509548 [Pelagophyceae sp. CCMP2097]
MSGARAAVGNYATKMKTDPAERINVAWYCTLFFSTVTIICAIAVAVDLDAKGKNGSKGAAFAAIWAVLMLLVLCVAGTLVLRKFRTNMMIGLLLGSSAMMAQMMFMLFAIFAGLATDDRGYHGTDQTFAAFAFFCAVFLSLFTFVLFFDRHHVLAAPQPAPPPKGDINSAGLA